jgi:hypothetical protein
LRQLQKALTDKIDRLARKDWKHTSQDPGKVKRPA